MSRTRALLVIVTLSTFVQSAKAYPRKPLRLEELANQAEIIAVVDIEKLTSSGTVHVDVDGRLVPSISYTAGATLVRRIKGLCENELKLQFVQPIPWVGYPSVAPGVQLAFLKRFDLTYEFADPHYPTLPAVADVQVSSTPNGEALGMIVAELGAVISSISASVDKKWAVVNLAYGIPNDNKVFVESLRNGLNSTNNPDLKYRIQAELISRDDLQQLSQAVQLLLSERLSVQQREFFVSAIENKLANSNAVPDLEQLLRSSDVVLRRASAKALWRIADPSSVPELLRELADPDQQVRFYVVRAFSDIANETGWGGPGESQFQEREGEYIRHWRTWAQIQHR